MDRNDEYLTLMSEIENIPEQLENAEKRAEARLRSERRRRIFTVPLGSLALFLIVFTVLVNCFPGFAYACGRIPLIKELAQAVAFSTSLSAAVENQYVQPIEQEQTINGVTARIEYVIVDQRQLNIFYSLDSDICTSVYVNYGIKAIDGTQLGGYCMASTGSGEPNGELKLITVDFVDRDMPDSMLITLKVYDSRSVMGDAPVTKEGTAFSNNERKEPETISEFTFPLKFDPYYTGQGEDIILNHSFELDGENLILKDTEIYPTHIRFNFSDKKDNTVWLKELSFYLENEKGERFGKTTNGVTATGSPDSPMMVSHRLESSFFSNSKELTLYITGVKWLDKDMERVKLDLANVTADRLPQGVTFEKAERRDKGWIVTFQAKQYGKNASYQIWGNDYYDEQNNKYTFNSWSSGIRGYWDEKTQKYIETPDVFREEIPLNNYPYNTVYMSPDFSRRVELSEPVVIKIK